MTASPSRIGGHIPENLHEIGKRNTQKIERKNLTIELGSNALIAKPSAFQNWNYCMIPLSVCSSIRSSLGLIFMRNYRFDPLPLLFHQGKNSSFLHFCHF
jgi:hypothetical protein